MNDSVSGLPLPNSQVAVMEPNPEVAELGRRHSFKHAGEAILKESSRAVAYVGRDNVVPVLVQFNTKVAEAEAEVGCLERHAELKTRLHFHGRDLISVRNCKRRVAYFSSGVARCSLNFTDQAQVRRSMEELAIRAERGVDPDSVPTSAVGAGGERDGRLVAVIMGGVQVKGRRRGPGEMARSNNGKENILIEAKKRDSGHLATHRVEQHLVWHELPTPHFQISFARVHRHGGVDFETFWHRQLNRKWSVVTLGPIHVHTDHVVGLAERQSNVVPSAVIQCR
mmetsp:Transcript_28392/g.65404  ORF Transcript_28392/g.65404 Transcript_28392/m.65404 type:complete len:282 (-) Transcript_28392:587-1432(-)